MYPNFFRFGFVCIFLMGSLVQAAPPASAPAVGAQDNLQLGFEVEKYKLANGLTVLLHVDRSAPIISYHTWFRVGSKYEKPGITGIAHLFEHMMFRGAKRYDGKQFDTVLDAIGGTNNAFTTRDYTGYYITLPSDKLELAIDLESDRMENLRITAENLAAEREVVKEERRFRVDNNVMGAMYESVFENLYKTHSYRWPVIGWMEDLTKISLENCKAFFKTYYAPNNAVVVIAGDFDKEKAKTLLEKYYGVLSAQSIPTYQSASEGAFQARDVNLQKEIEGQHLVYSYRTPKADSSDNYIMDLLANVLGEGTSSRLYKRLVLQSQLASSVSAWNMSMQDSSVFGIYVGLKPGADVDLANKIVMAELWKVRNQSVSLIELQKVKTQVMKSQVDSLKKIEGKAHSLALNEIVHGDYRRLFDDLKIYDGIKLEDIKRVGNQYLNPGQRLLIQMRPKKAKEVKALQEKVPEKTMENAPDKTEAPQ